MRRKNQEELVVSEHTIIQPRLADAFADAMERKRVILFSAPCGFGKTTTAHGLLRGRRVRRVEAGHAGFALPSAQEDWDVLLVDSLQLLRDENAQALCALIRENPERRFVLLTRGGGARLAGPLPVCRADAGAGGGRPAF